MPGMRMAPTGPGRGDRRRGPMAVSPACMAAALRQSACAPLAALADEAEGADGGGDHRRRQRGSIKVGSRGEAQRAEGRVIGDAIAADDADALGEGADDDVDIGLDALRLRDAARLVAVEAERMGLVDEDDGAGGLGRRDEGRQVGKVAEDAVDALDDDEDLGRRRPPLPR